MPELQITNVLLINQSYRPDRGASGQLLAQLFEGLVNDDQSLRVTVVAAPPTYTDEPILWAREEKSRDQRLVIYRVGPSRFRGRKSVLNRLASYLGYMWAAWWKVYDLSKRQRFDVILTASNPPFVGAIGAWYSRVMRIPFIYMLHDIHPDLYMATSGRELSKLVVALWDLVNRFTFSTARQITVVTDSMKDYLSSYKQVPDSKIQVIYQWALPEISEPDVTRVQATRSQLGIGNRECMVLYFGNMSPVHNLDWLIEIAPKLKVLSVQIVLAGDGPQKKHLEARAKDLGLTNVLFLPYLTGQAFEDLLLASDICVSTLKIGLERMAFPSKTYVIMSAAKPILGVVHADSDLARILTKDQCGWVSESPKEVVQVLSMAAREPQIMKESGQKAREVYNLRFSFSRAKRQHRGLLATINSSRIS